MSNACPAKRTSGSSGVVAVVVAIGMGGLANGGLSGGVSTTGFKLMGLGGKTGLLGSWGPMNGLEAVALIVTSVNAGLVGLICCFKSTSSLPLGFKREAVYLFCNFVTSLFVGMILVGNLMDVVVSWVMLELNSKPGMSSSGRGIPVAKGGAGN